MLIRFARVVRGRLCVKGGGSAAEVGFAVGLGGWREEVEEDWGHGGL